MGFLLFSGLHDTARLTFLAGPVETHGERSQRETEFRAPEHRSREYRRQGHIGDGIAIDEFVSALRSLRPRVLEPDRRKQLDKWIFVRPLKILD